MSCILIEKRGSVMVRRDRKQYDNEDASFRDRDPRDERRNFSGSYHQELDSFSNRNVRNKDGSMPNEREYHRSYRDDRRDFSEAELRNRRAEYSRENPEYFPQGSSGESIRNIGDREAYKKQRYGRERDDESFENYPEQRYTGRYERERNYPRESSSKESIRSIRDREAYKERHYRPGSNQERFENYPEQSYTERRRYQDHYPAEEDELEANHGFSDPGYEDRVARYYDRERDGYRGEETVDRRDYEQEKIPERRETYPRSRKTLDREEGNLKEQFAPRRENMKVAKTSRKDKARKTMKTNKTNTTKMRFKKAA